MATIDRFWKGSFKAYFPFANASVFMKRMVAMDLWEPYAAWAKPHVDFMNPELTASNLFRVNKDILDLFMSNVDEMNTLTPNMMVEEPAAARALLATLKLAVPSDDCEWFFKKSKDTVAVNFVFTEMSESPQFKLQTEAAARAARSEATQPPPQPPPPKKAKTGANRGARASKSGKDAAIKSVVEAEVNRHGYVCCAILFTSCYAQLHAMQLYVLVVIIVVIMLLATCSNYDHDCYDELLRLRYHSQRAIAICFSVAEATDPLSRTKSVPLYQDAYNASESIMEFLKDGDIDTDATDAFTVQIITYAVSKGLTMDNGKTLRSYVNVRKYLKHKLAVAHERVLAAEDIDNDVSVVDAAVAAGEADDGAGGGAGEASIVEEPAQLNTVAESITPAMQTKLGVFLKKHVAMDATIVGSAKFVRLCPLAASVSNAVMTKYSDSPTASADISKLTSSRSLAGFLEFIYDTMAIDFDAPAFLRLVDLFKPAKDAKDRSEDAIASHIKTLASQVPSLAPASKLFLESSCGVSVCLDLVENVRMLVLRVAFKSLFECIPASSDDADTQAVLRMLSNMDCVLSNTDTFSKLMTVDGQKLEKSHWIACWEQLATVGREEDMPSFTKKDEKDMC